MKNTAANKWIQYHLRNISNLFSMLVNINIEQKQIKKQLKQVTGPAFGLEKYLK